MIAYADAYGWKLEWEILIPEGEDPSRPANATAAEFLLRSPAAGKTLLPAELEQRDDTWFATYTVARGEISMGIYSVQLGLHFGPEVYDLTDPSILTVM